MQVWTRAIITCQSCGEKGKGNDDCSKKSVQEWMRWHWGQSPSCLDFEGRAPFKVELEIPYSNTARQAIKKAMGRQTEQQGDSRA